MCLNYTPCDRSLSRPFLKHFMGTGKRCRIKAVTGDDAIRHRLGALGFVEGMEVEVVAEVAGNLVVGVLGSRVAVDGGLAQRILV